ncbi:MAG: single-stranded DNA-binding protein [Candidatus Latescibacterota bacterium]|nr:single-stranded DNA-binding protein [Candidatus Latescibacterota bacterium]
MPSCVNRVVLVGNLGADPDTRFTPTGTQVVTANLATDDTWTDRQGTKRQRTEWHRLVLWRRLAEIASQYLHKGSRVYIEGRLHSRSWEDGEGHRNYLTEIVVSDLRILDASANGPAELDLLYAQSESQAEVSVASTPNGSDDYGLPF